jgi:hypothetical protein
MYPRIIFILLFPLIGIAQSPQKINFQSVIRNNLGEVQYNKSVSLRISILSGSISGSSVFSETHTKTTDIFGLISLQIGNTPLAKLSNDDLLKMVEPGYIKRKIIK